MAGLHYDSHFVECRKNIVEIKKGFEIDEKYRNLAVLRRLGHFGLLLFPYLEK